MANNALKISELSACTNPAAADLLVMTANSGANTLQCTVNNFLNNTAANITANVITSTVLVINTTTTPANNTDVPTNFLQGSMWSDGSYIYYMSSNTEIKRSALSTF